jgi:hypothetical protein
MRDRLAPTARRRGEVELDFFSFGDIGLIDRVLQDCVVGVQVLPFDESSRTVSEEEKTGSLLPFVVRREGRWVGRRPFFASET